MRDPFNGFQCKKQKKREQKRRVKARRHLGFQHLESRRVPAILTDNSWQTDTHINTDGALSLREAIEVVAQGNTNNLDPSAAAQVNQNTELLGTNDKIVFDSSLSGQTILLSRQSTFGQLEISKNLIIDAGSLPAGITVKGDDQTPGTHNDGRGTRLFNITDTSGGITPPRVTMIGMKLTGADPSFGTPSQPISPQGGAIYCAGILTLRNMDITENGADYGAGVFVAVAANGGTARTILDIENSHIDANSAFFGGGAVYLSFTSTSGGQDTVQINNSTLSNNNAGLPRASVGRGGALFITSNSDSDASHAVVISGSTFDTNFADWGGAISDESQSHVDLSILQGSKITGNTAQTESGGGLYAQAKYGSALLIQDSTVSGNTSAKDGGGVLVELHHGSALAVQNSTISGNTAGINNNFANGGGIAAQLYESSLSVSSSSISGNSANLNGGGLSATVIEYDPFHPFPTPRAITISRSLISGNTAGTRGGGVYTKNLPGTETLVEESRITGNTIPFAENGDIRNGGGMYTFLESLSPTQVNPPRFTITGSTVDNNATDLFGGGIFLCSKFNGVFVATNSTFSANRTTDPNLGAGGGVFVASPPPPDNGVDAYFRNCTVTQNVSADGGGIRVKDLDNMHVHIANSIISQNFNLQAPPNNKSDLVGRVVLRT